MTDNLSVARFVVYFVCDKEVVLAMKIIIGTLVVLGSEKLIWHFPANGDGSDSL